jgi:dienelactone hydrolase
MRVIPRQVAAFLALLCSGVGAVAASESAIPDCSWDARPATSFVEVDSIDVVTKTPLKVKGKLTLPVDWHRGLCGRHKHAVPAVVILHGSGGVDFRGNFYAEALNATGMATLEIDMWEARGIDSPAERPPHPAYTYPDAFGALAFLSTYPGIDATRVGVLGFSWGGVMSVASATEGVVAQFGGGVLRFKAHAAHYPVCYAYNSPYVPGSQFGTHAGNPLTGAPILIQIGEEDDYDMGSGPCQALKASLVASEQRLVSIVAYDGAAHAWDRLLVPTEVEDSFAHRGAGGVVRMVPDVAAAYQARDRVVRFFLRQF